MISGGRVEGVISHLLFAETPQRRGGEERKGHRALTGCLLVSSFGDESTPLFLFWAPESLFCKQAIPSLIALLQIGFLDVHDTQVTAMSGSGYHFL